MLRLLHHLYPRPNIPISHGVKVFLTGWAGPFFAPVSLLIGNPYFSSYQLNLNMNVFILVLEHCPILSRTMVHSELNRTQVNPEINRAMNRISSFGVRVTSHKSRSRGSSEIFRVISAPISTEPASNGFRTTRPKDNPALDNFF